MKEAQEEEEEEEEEEAEEIDDEEKKVRCMVNLSTRKELAARTPGHGLDE